MTMQNKILAPSPRQPLNGQGVLRISGFKVAKEKLKNGLGLDSEAGMLGVYLAEGRRCEELKKRKVDVCCLQNRKVVGQGQKSDKESGCKSHEAAKAMKRR